MDPNNVIKISADAQNHINAYIDYQYNAGVSDKPFSPEEYAKFKKKQKENSKNRVFVCWVNTKSRVCKNIGPATRCFCNHRFKDHNYLTPKDKKVKCKAPKCACKCYEYIPAHGSYDFKCLCKHSYRDHGARTKKCKKCPCSKFDSRWSCSCGLMYREHETVIETWEERVKSGKAVGEVARMLMDPMVFGAGNGNGIESFMDMVDGAERFGAKVDEMVEKRKELGYGDGAPKALKYNDEKHQQLIEAGKGGGGWRGAKKGQEVMELDEGKLVAGIQGDEVSALDLFKKPHKWDIYQDYERNRPKAIGYHKTKSRRKGR